MIATQSGWRSLMDRRLIGNVYCPTGDGGGIDPSCPLHVSPTAVREAIERCRGDVCQIGVELAKMYSSDDASYADIWTGAQDVFEQETMEGSPYTLKPDKHDEYIKKLLGHYRQGKHRGTATDNAEKPQPGFVFNATRLKRRHNPRFQRNRRPNPLRIDPSGTAGERRAFVADIRRRFEKLRLAIRQLVVREDEFGLMTANVFCSTGEGGGVDPTCSLTTKAPGEMNFDEYLSKVTSEGDATDDAISSAIISSRAKNWFDDDDKVVSSVPTKEGQVRIRQAGRKSFYAELDGKVVGYIEGSGHDEFASGQVSLAIDDPRLEGRGVGTELVWQFRQRFPFHKSGGLSRGGLRVLKKVHERFKKGLVANTQRWKFRTTDAKLAEFRKWLAVQLKLQGLLFKHIKGRENDWWERYIREVYRKGQGRAFDEVMRKTKGDRSKEKLDWYDGNREQFVRSSFGRPASVEKVKALASRNFGDLRGMTRDMQTRLGRTLVDGLINGRHPREIARDLEKQLKISRARAETIARTEIVRSLNEGQLDSLETLGVTQIGVAVEWSTSGLGETAKGNPSPCEVCAPLQGVVLSIEEARQAPLPRHPNCTCSWIPANVGEDQEEQVKSHRAIERALERSVEAEGGKKKTRWAGADAEIEKVRPKSVFNQEEHPPEFDEHFYKLYGDDSLNQPLIEFEKVVNAGDNCGIGPDGFEPGNTCAKGGSLKDKLEGLRGKIAKAAQKVYDEWKQDDEGVDEECGSGGICDLVSQGISGIVAGEVEDAEIHDGGQEGDDHAYPIIKVGDKAYGVDIPPSVYESGGGYSWKKIEGVEISPGDIVIFEVDASEFDRSE